MYRLSSISKLVNLLVCILLLTNIATAQVPVANSAQKLPEPSSVKINVLVADGKGHFVGDAKAEDFHLFEDGVEQQITFFERDESPLSYGLIVDNSGSLRNLMNTVVSVARGFVKYNRPQDETFVVRFVDGDNVKVLEDFTSSQSALSKALDGMYVQGGQTAIIDALYLSANHMIEHHQSEASHPRRQTLVLITDGEDRSSYYKLEELLKVLGKSDIQIFCVGLVGQLDKAAGLRTPSKRERATVLLTRLAHETGGRTFAVKNVSELQDAFDDIMHHLRTQYVVGYVPPVKPHGRSSRKIEIRMAKTTGDPNSDRVAITRPRYAIGGEVNEEKKNKN